MVRNIRADVVWADGHSPSGIAPDVSGAGEPMDTAREIFQRYRRGESVEALARRYGFGPSKIRRILARERYQRIMQLPLEYIPNPEFERYSAEEEARVLGPAPQPESPVKRVRPPAGLPPYLASLYETPLLTREQEVHLFRKMNYLKFKAARLREQLSPAQPSCALMDQIERLYQQSVAVKNEIIRANLRLVVAIAKRYATSSESLFELVSDGNISLIRAVEKFDFARGFKFSTYATWAIIKNFARTIPTEQKYHTRFRTGAEEMFQSTADTRAHPIAEESAQYEAVHQVARIMDRLDERERQIIQYRFGLATGCEPMTLKEVGSAMGVTKERIRQIETRAMAKLRRAAIEEGVELPEGR